MTTIAVNQNALRSDLRAIADLIPDGVRVLDLGCGDGALLEYVIEQKNVMGRGIELREEDILTCVRHGLSVRQGNIEEGLADYPDASFDCVILSQTLHFLDDPVMVLREMLRVGHHAIVSFPNWGYWRCRLDFLLRGRIPRAYNVPELWYEWPRWQALTISDFGDFCQQQGVVVNAQVYLRRDGSQVQTRYKNLLATTAVFSLGRE